MTRNVIIDYINLLLTEHLIQAGQIRLPVPKRSSLSWGLTFFFLLIIDPRQSAQDIQKKMKRVAVTLTSITDTADSFLINISTL